MPDKISAIIVCFNESVERICYTIDSIVGQDYPTLEVIVVDGGSEKETLSAFEPYHKYLRTFISEPDRGLYDAMNKGIKAATGAWIIFMNIGDRFHSCNVLTTLMNTPNIEDCEMLYGDILRDGWILSRPPNRLSRKYLFCQTLCHQAILVRRRIFDFIGTFDISFHLIADRDWIYRFVAAGHSYAHVPVTVCDWEIGGICSDYRTHNKELRRYRLQYFTLFERRLYGCLWIMKKALRRVKSLNFTMPVRLRDRL